MALLQGAMYAGLLLRPLAAGKAGSTAAAATDHYG
jgi:hypothetical protein